MNSTLHPNLAPGVEPGVDSDASPDASPDALPRVRITERRLLSAAWARLEGLSLRYRRQDGRLDDQQREVYHRGHGAAILLYHPGRRTVLLVRQFRIAAWEVEAPQGAYHAGHIGHVGRDRRGTDAEPGFLLEVPAGMIERASGAATIAAEAREEAGVDIGEPHFLFAAYASPGSVTERLQYFSAPYADVQRTGDGGGLASEGEDIEVVELSVDEAWSRVQSGAIRDAKTILLLQHALLGPLRS